MEGEDLIAANRLRLLDPATAITDAVALHQGVERHNPASDFPCYERSVRVPRFGYKDSAVYLFVLSVVDIGYLALSDDKYGSIPSGCRIVDQRSRYKEEAVPCSRPICQVQITIDNHRHRIGGGHAQRIKIRLLRSSRTSRDERGHSILYDVLSKGIDLRRGLQVCWKGGQVFHIWQGMRGCVASVVLLRICGRRPDVIRNPAYYSIQVRIITTPAVIAKKTDRGNRPWCGIARAVAVNTLYGVRCIIGRSLKDWRRISAPSDG